MARKKQQSESLFDALTIDPVVAEAKPGGVVVARDEPQATAPLPENVVRFPTCEPFCEEHCERSLHYWVGIARSERTSASILFSKDELVKLHRRIGAVLKIGE